MARPVMADLRLVDERLAAWGDWARSASSDNGWPPRTMLGKVIEEGFTGAAQGGPPPTQIPEAVAETDRAIAQLPPKYLRVVKIWYASSVRYNQCAGAKLARMDTRRFRQILQVARELVKHNLLGAELCV